MAIDRVIDKLEAYIQEGTWLPAGYRILSQERLVEFIEKLRSDLPEEMSRAKIIARDKDRVIRDAQEKAQAIVTDANATQNELLNQSDIVRQARTTAEIVLREAEERAQKIKEGADAYAASILSDLEQRLTVVLGSVKKGQQTLSAPPRSSTRTATRPIESTSLVDAAAQNKRAAFDAAEETAALETV